MTLALVVAALLGGGPAVADTIEVELLSSRPTRALAVAGPGGRRDVALGDGGLLVDGRPISAPLRFARGRWRILPPRGAPRSVIGALEIRPAPDRLRVIARLDLEEYVAWTVASETAPGTLDAALRAQAVVARSYALAGNRRHPDVDRCDLAHCQVLRGDLDRDHRAAARRAAEATAGEVLLLPSGRIALAPFHAACGGHTADPREVFGGEGTGAAAVLDPVCPAKPWRAVLPRQVFDAVVRERLGRAAPPEALSWRVGRGGFVAQVALGTSVTAGESFARALDGRLGHRTVRSARFTARSRGDAVVLEGTGLGHGVGLCQAGAALRASRGRDHREILAHYFPEARLARPPR